MQLLTFLCDIAIPNRIKFSATESLFDSNKHSLPCSRLIFYFPRNYTNIVDTNISLLFISYKYS